MKKPDLCTQNTPIHITVGISPSLFRILEIYKLHEIAYEKLHKWYKFPMITYKVILRLKLGLSLMCRHNFENNR